jgi:hypothetical protein
MGIFHNMRYANGSWSGWGDVEGQVGQIGANVAAMNDVRVGACFGNLYVISQIITDQVSQARELGYARRVVSDGTWSKPWYAMPRTRSPAIPVELWSDYTVVKTP